MAQRAKRHFILQLVVLVFMSSAAHCEPTPSLLLSVSKLREVVFNAVAYNSDNNENVVAWAENLKKTDSASKILRRIFVQRFTANSGLPVGPQMPIGENNYLDMFEPAITYNPQQHEYFLVWVARPVRKEGILVFEIHGQRLDGSTAQPIGASTPLGNLGSDLDKIFGVVPNVLWTVPCNGGQPAVTYNDRMNEYFVVWAGCAYYPTNESEPNQKVYRELEIFAQRVRASNGEPFGIDDERISFMGTERFSESDALMPSVAYNSQYNQYLIAWLGHEGKTPSTPVRDAIFGQVIDANTGNHLSTTNKYLIAPKLRGEFNQHDAGLPIIVFNEIHNEYLMVWEQYDTDNPEDPGNGIEIFAARISPSGDLLSNAVISRSGPDQCFQCRSSLPKLAYNPSSDSYAVIWFSSPQGNNLFWNLVKLELNGLDATPSGSVEIVNSTARPFRGFGDNWPAPALVYNSSLGVFFAVWWSELYEITGAVYHATGHGLFGQLLKSVDESPTPIPTSTPTPTPEVKEKLKTEVKRRRGANYTFRCVRANVGPAQSFSLSIFRSADKKLDLGRDKLIKKIGGTIAIGAKEGEAIKIKETLRKRASYPFLVAYCE